MFFSVTAGTATYPLSLHDALPISSGIPEAALLAHGRDDCVQYRRCRTRRVLVHAPGAIPEREHVECGSDDIDRKSTRLNSSHTVISYAVFCLKKKKT